MLGGGLFARRAQAVACKAKILIKRMSAEQKPTRRLPGRVADLAARRIEELQLYVSHPLTGAIEVLLDVGAYEAGTFPSTCTAWHRLRFGVVEAHPNPGSNRVAAYGGSVQAYPQLAT